MTTQSLTFIGESGTAAMDGYAGFRTGQTYNLRIERREDGSVAIAIDHGSPGAVLELSQEKFERWFKRS